MCNFDFINLALAIFTGGLFFTAFWALKQQGKYYEATTRPFVNYVDKTLEVEAKIYTESIDTADVKFSLMNYGNLPAKYVQCDVKFFSDENHEFKKIFNKEEDSFVIYPKHEIPQEEKEEQIVYNDKRESHLHIAVTYKDMDGKTHNSLGIFLLTFIPVEGDFNDPNPPPMVTYRVISSSIFD